MSSNLPDFKQVVTAAAVGIVAAVLVIAATGRCSKGQAEWRTPVPHSTPSLAPAPARR